MQKKLVRNALSGKNRPIKAFSSLMKKNNNCNIKLYKSSSDFLTFNGNDFMINTNEKNKNIEKTKQNYNNLYDKLNEDNNYISRIKNLIKSEEEKKNCIDINRNKIPELSNQQILPISVSNAQNNNNNINYDTNLIVTTPKIDKGRLLNESFKIRKNNTLLLLKKKN